jgi:HAD superfamily hydrolase (TIGR01490 family)
MSAAAFFDVDNTLVRGASLYYFGKGLAARGLVTQRDLLQFGWDQLVFRLSGKEDLKTALSVREKALGLVAGLPATELVAHAEHVYDDVLQHRIWAGTRALAERHLAAGDPVVLVTATPVELATVIADRLGLTGALGTVSEVVAGRYTGRLVGEPLHGPLKARAVQELAARRGWDLTACTAYSDSAHDLPLLTAVGRAVAVNPDRELRAVAVAQGWDVHDWRTARRPLRPLAVAQTRRDLSGRSRLRRRPTGAA